MTDEVRKILGDEIPWLRDRAILVTLTGSFAYGTNVEGSDKDYKGICIPPESYYYGLEKFEHFDTTGHNGKFKDKITDVSIAHINKFVSEAMRGTPNNIEILFTRPDDILYKDAYGFADEIISKRHLFLTKAVKYRMAGYAHSQVHHMLRCGTNPGGREDLKEKYGYDCKFFMHAVRLLTSAIEILKTGDLSTYRPNRNDLLKCRNGYYSLEQAVVIINDLGKEVDAVFDTSTIPHSPDYNTINTWLVDLNKRALQYKVFDQKPCETLGSTQNTDRSVKIAKAMITRLFQ